MQKDLCVCVLVSGSGTTLEAILKAIGEGRLPRVRVALVVASRDGIGAIEKAQNAGVWKGDIVICDPRSYRGGSDEFGEEILRQCGTRAVDFIGQYGWMPKTPQNVIGAYRHKMVNQHPGALDPTSTNGDFGGTGMYGRRVIAAQLYFARMIGRPFFAEATAQEVHPEFDKGRVLRAWKVRIYPSADTVESLQKRVIIAEHQVQIATLGDFANGHVRPFTRLDLLVRRDETDFLARAKKKAIEDYPKG